MKVLAVCRRLRTARANLNSATTLTPKLFRSFPLMPRNLFPLSLLLKKPKKKKKTMMSLPPLNRKLLSKIPRKRMLWRKWNS
jgi:hypothetical protein